MEMRSCKTYFFNLETGGSVKTTIPFPYYVLGAKHLNKNQNINPSKVRLAVALKGETKSHERLRALNLLNLVALLSILYWAYTRSAYRLYRNFGEKFPSNGTGIFLAPTTGLSCTTYKIPANFSRSLDMKPGTSNPIGKS